MTVVLFIIILVALMWLSPRTLMMWTPESEPSSPSSKWGTTGDTSNQSDSPCRALSTSNWAYRPLCDIGR